MPDLVCNMTNEQWLDSFSAPRIDPINSTKRYMTTLTGDDDLSSTDSEGEYAYYSEGDGEKGIGEDGEDVESEKEVEDEAGSGAAV